MSYRYDTPVESKTTIRPFDAGSEFRLDGLFGPPSAVTHDFTFTAGTATSIALSNVWVSGAPPLRLVGVNIDLLDAMGQVLASDTFNGVVNGQAFSTLGYTGLVAGSVYTVELTGTALGTALYQIEASSADTAGPAAPLPLGQEAPSGEVVFDTRQGDKTLVAGLSAGEAFRAESIVSEGAPGVVSNGLSFTVRETRDFAGAFTWVTGSGSPRETVGFNADLLDSAGNVVASDRFQGVTNGQAFSTFDTVLAPGDYQFLVTALSQGNGTRYRLDVSAGGDAPAFDPLPNGPGPDPGTAVSEPASGLMVGSGLLALVALWRRVGRGTERSTLAC